MSNGEVFSENVANYSKPFRYIWDEVAVLVTFESDWESAKRILDEIAQRHADTVRTAAEPAVLAAAGRLLLPASELAAGVYTSVRDSGVLLSLRYLVARASAARRSRAIWEERTLSV